MKYYNKTVLITFIGIISLTLQPYQHVNSPSSMIKLSNNARYELQKLIPYTNILKYDNSWKLNAFSVIRLIGTFYT